MDSNKQTEAVFKSSRTDVDPVSGNEVPPGATAEEVRDDIPAMLSENEYVVPADVVRYFGVRFFEDLRNKAKEDMVELEEGGRIGGEPIEDGGDDLPFDISELSVIDEPDEEAEVGFYGGGSVIDPDVAKMKTPDFLGGIGSLFGSGDEYKTFKNAAGLIMNVRFVNGKPMSYIPPGYVEQGTATEEAAAAVTTEAPAPTVRSTNTELGDGPGNEGNTPVGRSAAKANTTEQAPSVSSNNSSVVGKSMYDGKTAAELSDIAGRLSKADKISDAVSFASPVVGLAGAVANKAQNQAVARAAQTGYNTATNPQEKAKFAEVFNQVTTGGKAKGSGILGGGGLMGGGGTLGDSNNDGSIGFGDTALGDALGFDGKIGIQGDSIADSFQGSRRTGGTGKKSSDLSSTTKSNKTSSTTTSGKTGGTSNSGSTGKGFFGGYTSIADTVDGGGPGASGDKIVCTAMNQSYGFGSYRQAIWLKYSKDHMTKEHEVGYHKIFMPLVHKAYNSGENNNMLLRRVLENIARHRTADIRAETQGKKRDLIGRMYRAILEPTCYLVGLLSKDKSNGT